MKALTIREPFASLIKEGYKKYETRSFKTNYRGELYIHAGKAKVKEKQFENRPHLKELSNNRKKEELDKIFASSYVKIILKCNLKDCIYMDEEFINEIKKDEDEYACGHYEIGRYAWLLEDIEVIDPIEINGQLGLWNFER